MRILVTGAAGMIGRPLRAALLGAGYSVVALDPLRPAREAGNWLTSGLDTLADALDMLERERIERIVHAGGISGPMIAPHAPYELFRVNVVCSMNLLEAARRAGIERFVFCSSGAAYGDTLEDPVPESAPLRPIEMYGASKAMMEAAIPVFRAQHGLDALSVRLSHVYGPGRSTDCVIRRMIGDALSGRTTELAWGRGYARPYCYIDDAVDGLMLALLGGPPTQPHYNIGTDAMTSIERIAELVQTALPAARIVLGEGPPPGGTRRNLPSISAAARDFGFRPRIDIAAGIRRYIAWAKERGNV